MIDIHCHLLPNIDDGSKSWEMTLEMCAMAQQDGIEHIVATPHSNYEYTYDRKAYTGMVEDLQGRFPAIAFSLGCDFHLSFDNIQKALKEPGTFSIGDTRYLLVELSEYGTFNLSNTLFDLQRAGYIPIVTHPERNPFVMRHPELVDQFYDAGCLIQITANSLTGSWGKVSQKLCERFLKKNQVHFIATDAHSLRSRPPILSKALKAASKIVGEKAAQKLVIDNPAAVVTAQYTLQ